MNAASSKQATVVQPQPNEGKQRVICGLIDDLKAREQVGLNTYGKLLQTNNGRDALVDAYQEVLDLAMYLKQLIMERG